VFIIFIDEGFCRQGSPNFHRQGIFTHKGLTHVSHATTQCDNMLDLLRANILTGTVVSNAMAMVIVSVLKATDTILSTDAP